MLALSIIAMLASAALLGAPAAHGKATVIKTIGPEGGTHDGPSDLAINRKTNTVYTVWVGGDDGTGFASDFISAIDGKTDEIVATIGVRDHPFGLAVDEKANLVYVSEVGGNPAVVNPGPTVSGGGGTISVIDGKTNTVIETIDIPAPPNARFGYTDPPTVTSGQPIENGAPGEIAFDPETGLLWVANTGEIPLDPQMCCTVPGVLSAYDTKTKQWVRGGVDGIPAGVTPIQPVVDTKANRVYVGSLHSNEVTVVNSHTLKTVAHIDVLPEPYGIDVDPRRHRLYVGHLDPRAVLETGDGTAEVTPYRSVLEVIDTETNKLQKPVYAGSFTGGVAVNPLTGRVYVSNLPTATVTILSPALKVIQEVDVGYGPRLPAFNPSTDKLYVGNSAHSSYPNFANAGLDGLPDSISVMIDEASRRHGGGHGHGPGGGPAGLFPINTAPCDQLQSKLAKSERALKETKDDLDKLEGEYPANPTSAEIDRLKAKEQRLLEKRRSLRILVDRLKREIAERCPEAPGTQPPPNQPPVITAFTAVFPADPCGTCTGYAVEATDEDPATLTYTWSKAPPDGATNPEHTNCGTFTPNSPTPREAIWNHPNGEPTDTPPGCAHPATEHPGWITVVVTDAQGLTASCTYKSGSAPTSTPDPATNCT
jgi:YVTN family beta-propeller protein